MCIQRKKVLFATPLKIMTALHLIEYYNFDADIICLADYLDDVDDYVTRLNRLNIFNSIKIVVSTDNEELSLDTYDELFVANDIFLYAYQEQIVRSKVKVSVFDEGSMSYLRYFMESCYSCCGCHTVYLYEPTFANYYGDSRFDIRIIPKIENTNYKLLKKINEMFEVDENNTVDCKENVLHIFFSQPFEHVLSWKARIRRLIKLFTYRSAKEYVLEEIKITQQKLISHIHNRGVKLFRKFHGREKLRNTLVPVLDITYPWELYLLNHPHTHVVQYSLFSSVLTASFVLGDGYHLKSYYLYPIVVKELEKYGDVDVINGEVLEFFDRLVKAGKVIPVYSLEELERICQNEV